MFSSPAIQIFSSENAENLVQRKAGSQLMSRKPFIDRSVNGESPFDRKLNLKNTSKKNTDIKQKISPKLAKQEYLEDSDLDAEDFIFSGKEIEDTYDDVWPSFTIGTDTRQKLLSGYWDPQTPPPSPCEERKPAAFLEIDPDFLELPPFMCKLEEPPLCDSSFEVDLPTLGAFEDDYDSSF